MGPWGSEGLGLLCCLVPRHPQPQFWSQPSPSPVPVPAPVPVPVSSQFHRSPSPSLSPVPVPVPSQSRPSSAQPSPAPPAGQELTSEPSWWSFRHRKTTKALDGEDGGSAMDCEAKRGKKVSTFWGLWGGQEQPHSARGAWDEGWEMGRGGSPPAVPWGRAPRWRKFGDPSQEEPCGARAGCPPTMVTCPQTPLSLAGLRVAHQAAGFPQSGSEAGSPQQRVPAAAALGAPLPPRLPDRPPDPAARLRGEGGEGNGMGGPPGTSAAPFAMREAPTHRVLAPSCPG